MLYVVDLDTTTSERSVYSFKIFDPNHPLADGEGYIYKAPKNVEEEMVDMMDASRQYQNNIEVVTTLKALTLKTINLGK